MNITNEGESKNNDNFGIKIFLIIFIFLFSFIAIFLTVKFSDNNPDQPIITVQPNKSPAININEVRNFTSEKDFKDYLTESLKLSSIYGGRVALKTMTNDMMPVPGMRNESIDGTFLEPNTSNELDRVSGTNVQVIGIDEPDIVKTDGKEIYFSGQQKYYYSPMIREQITSDNKMIMPPVQPQERTSLIRAFPPANLKIDGMIDKQGDLLLSNNILVVFPNHAYYNNKQEISAYDVSDPESKTSKSLIKKWNITLENNTFVITSRLKDGKIYLITKSNIDQNRPCPIKPLSVGNSPINISCQEIYHPIMPIPIDTTFILSLIDVNTGKVEKNVSFVGSSYSSFGGASVIYVSKNAIYTTYSYTESIIKFISGFVKENNDIFSVSVINKIDKLNSYDISESSKMTEFAIIMENFESSLTDDEKLRFNNEMNNRMSDYYKTHSRELEKTGIVKINTDTFKISANGTVPGHLLNNFSMDEYQGNLRVASTIGSRWGIFNGIGSGESVSDVTILDKNLDPIGSVKDLGKTEQIYSVRFIGDKGYVVTFRQTDPFYIIDLANPKNPKMTGELKIPGYSSYLHPLDATHILGIGQEGSQVKISLFDIADKNNPMEIDKYLLNEYWTEVSNNYHAFLLDSKHNIFFLPGSKGGYVFSYNAVFARPGICKPDEICSNITDYGLKLKKTISQNSAKRALYINDYLYIISEDKITVLNENDWEKVNELNLNDSIQ